MPSRAARMWSRRSRACRFCWPFRSCQTPFSQSFQVFLSTIWFNQWGEELIEAHLYMSLVRTKVTCLLYASSEVKDAWVSFEDGSLFRLYEWKPIFRGHLAVVTNI